MRLRILNMLQYSPCSAQMMADVLRVPLADVEGELAVMARKGEIEKRVQVTYRLKEDEE